MKVITCDGTWEANGITNAISCNGTLQAFEYQDVNVLFQEYLAPDPEIIGLVSGFALTLFVVGIGIGKVAQTMRKI